MAVYQREHCRRSFDEDYTLHELHGIIIETDEFFAMGRPVKQNALQSEIVNPAHVFPPRECDCWHIYLFAGSMHLLFELMPFPLPWVSFERQNRLIFVPMERIRRYLNAISSGLVA
jgi:hypothetical protein